MLHAHDTGMVEAVSMVYLWSHAPPLLAARWLSTGWSLHQRTDAAGMLAYIAPGTDGVSDQISGWPAESLYAQCVAAWWETGVGSKQARLP